MGEGVPRHPWPRLVWHPRPDLIPGSARGSGFPRFRFPLLRDGKKEPGNSDSVHHGNAEVKVSQSQGAPPAMPKRQCQHISKRIWRQPCQIYKVTRFLLVVYHYLLYTETSKTKCHKQLDTSFQLSFLLLFQMVCSVLLTVLHSSTLLLIGCAISIANQNPTKKRFLMATLRAMWSTPSERAF